MGRSTTRNASRRTGAQRSQRASPPMLRLRSPGRRWRRSTRSTFWKRAISPCGARLSRYRNKWSEHLVSSSSTETGAPAAASRSRPSSAGTAGPSASRLRQSWPRSTGTRRWCGWQTSILATGGSGTRVTEPRNTGRPWRGSASHPTGGASRRSDRARRSGHVKLTSAREDHLRIERPQMRDGSAPDRIRSPP